MNHLYNPVLHSGINDIAKAKGECYYLQNGKKLIDLESGIWCASIGHQNEQVNQTIKNQLNSLTHISKRVLPAELDLIAKKLLKIANFDGKAIFLNTGSEAIEFSLIIARLINKNATIVSFADNYISAYGQATTIDQKIDLKPCLSCHREKCNTDCPVIHYKIKENTIFIFDPFCFSRQIIIPPLKLIQFIEKEIHRKGGILIVDEVTTGLGRTGKWFGYNHFNLTPDMVVLGKSLSNGYPVSAVMINKPIIKFLENTGFGYYQSHQNDPLGCKIAETVLDVMVNENLIDRSKLLGEVFLSLLQNNLSSIKGVVDIRGIGLLIGIELEKEILVEKVYQKLVEKGIIIGISIKYNMLNIIPPLTIDSDLFIEISEKIKLSINEVRDEKELKDSMKQSFNYYKA